MPTAVLALVALILSGIELVRSQGQSLLAWAVVLLSLAAGALSLVR
jgi:hypothetical protein